jgi:hypothetical protein
MSGVSANKEGQPAELIQLWRRSFDQWLEGWSALFEQTLTTPETAAAGGRALDSILNVEKPLRENTAEQMDKWLEFFNMPSRRDVLRLAAQVNDANARLDDLQVLIEDLSDQIAELTADRRRVAAGEKP